MGDIVEPILLTDDVRSSDNMQVCPLGQGGEQVQIRLGKIGQVVDGQGVTVFVSDRHQLGREELGK
ncbi:hypothetical protein D1872_317990 [compost metagenome]